MATVHIHYKGGLYVHLFTAKLVQYQGELPGDVHILRTVLHSDDRRELLLCQHPMIGLVLYDASRNSMPLMYDMVVYVSMTFGTVWARRKEEFEGKTKDGRSRFALAEFEEGRPLTQSLVTIPYEKLVP